MCRQINYLIYQVRQKNKPGLRLRLRILLATKNIKELGFIETGGKLKFNYTYAEQSYAFNITQSVKEKTFLKAALCFCSRFSSDFRFPFWLKTFLRNKLKLMGVKREAIYVNINIR